MALTPKQKELNKDATKRRNAAYRVRHNEYSAARDAENLPTVVEAKANADKIRQEESALFAARDEQLAEIEKQIAALRKKGEDLRAEFSSKIDPVSKARNKAYDHWRKLISEHQDKIDKQYPDVANCYSAAGWKEISEFMT